MPLSDAQSAERRAYANNLTEFTDQLAWYDQQANHFKTRAQRSDLLVIGSGALVAALSAIASASVWIGFLVGALGVLIAVIQGAQRIYRSSEIWPGYRLAAEAMKSETRMFVLGGGIYAVSFEKACAQYLIRMEAVLARERQQYFEDLATAQAQRNSGAARASDP